MIPPTGHAPEINPDLIKAARVNDSRRTRILALDAAAKVMSGAGRDREYEAMSGMLAFDVIALAQEFENYIDGKHQREEDGEQAP